MKDLQPQPLKKPLDRTQMGTEVAALNSLLSMLNNPEITGAAPPKGVETKAVVTPKREVLDKTGATIITSDPAVQSTPAPAIAVPSSPSVKPNTNLSKVFYTGLIGVGKDYIAEQTGAKIFGFADPLYHLAEYFFGVKVNSKEGKDIPGVREFLQAVGQWGRGEVNKTYPLTPARACFTSMIRSLGEMSRFDSQYEIDWSAFGRDPDIWLAGTTRRIDKYLEANPYARVAITNCRFVNEFKHLQASDFAHFHITCHPNTRASRVKVLGDPKDISEQLANFLDNDVKKKISAKPRGGKLRVIWNCTTPAPSPRLYSAPEFLSSFSASASADDINIMTGE